MQRFGWGLKRSEGAVGRNVEFNRRRWRIVIVAVVLFFLVFSIAKAQIYQYRDKNGVLHFTNVPTHSVTSAPRYKRYGRSGSNVRPKHSPYDHYIREASSQFGVTYPLLKAIVRAESDFNPKAVSSKGAVGLMQIMPQNFKRLNLKNPYDPRQNVMAGAKYFRSLLNRYDGRIKMALAAYNAGPTAVEHYQKIPPYPETQAYVVKVMRFYRAYQ